MEALLDVKDAARLLAVSPSMIRKLSRSGRLPVRKIGASARYLPGDIERLALGGDAETQDAKAF